MQAAQSGASSTSGHGSHSGPAQPLSAGPGAPLKGRLRPPGDKSISHRALILGLLSKGRTTIEGLLEGDDVLRTAAACGALGAKVERLGPANGRWTAAASARCSSPRACSTSAMRARAQG